VHTLLRRGKSLLARGLFKVDDNHLSLLIIAHKHDPVTVKLKRENEISVYFEIKARDHSAL
jgi:hypothetical protein